MWYHLNHTAIDTLGFMAFMKSVRENWLDPGWEQEVKLLILSSSQGSKPIANWIMLVESTNALLLSHTHALSMNSLCNHIQSHIHPDTMTAATTTELHLVTDYKKYKHMLKAAIHQMMSTFITTSNSMAKCSHNPHTSMNSSATSTINVDRPTSCSSNHCPPLTAGEHSLLVEHSGCWCFYCDHIAPTCTNGFSDKSSYKTLTEADTLAAKKHNSRKDHTTPAATVVPVNLITPVAVVMPSAVLGNSTDSEYMNTLFFVPHLYFACTIGGATVSTELSIHALIDDSSDAVLINPKYVDHLGLA